MKLFLSISLLAISAAFATGADAAPADAAPVQTAQASPNANLVEGEVRKIDAAQGKITLRHGRIPNLDMPGMTMVFKVADSKLLDGLKEGDKVKFTADRVGGAITVLTLEK